MLLHGVAGQAVDDPRVALVLVPEQAEQLAFGVGLRLDPVLDVRTVEARHEVPGLLQLEPGRDLAAGRLGGGRGEGDARDVRPAFVQAGQHQVVGTEVVPPLGHAVRLVDREERDVAPVEQLDGRGELQPLRRQVQQVELARDELRLDDPPLVEVLRGVEEARLTPAVRSASTWSCMRAMSGEMTMPVPFRTSAGIW